MAQITKNKIIYIAAAGKTVRSFLQAHLKNLTNTGYDVTLICSDSDETSEVRENTNVRYIPVSIKTDIAPFSDLLSVIKLAAILFKERPTVVHAHMTKAGLVSMLSAFITLVPHRIYHNHGMAAFSSKGAKRLLLESVEKFNCKLATQVIFCGNSTMHEAINRRLCSKEKAHVIGGGTISGIDTERFHRPHTPQQRTALRSRFNLQENSFVVGFVGRIVAHKGIDNIIKAWPLVSQDISTPTQLIIAGANDRNALFSRLNDLCDNDKNVMYLDRVDNIDEIYRAIDVLILPSWHEGFPYSVMEAQSSGTPAIVTEVPGNTDAVLADVTGLHVPVENPEALAEAIMSIAKNSVLREKMSLAASNRVRNFYSEEQVLENLGVFYQKLLHS